MGGTFGQTTPSQRGHTLLPLECIWENQQAEATDVAHPRHTTTADDVIPDHGAGLVHTPHVATKDPVSGTRLLFPRATSTLTTIGLLGGGLSHLYCFYVATYI